MIDSKLSNERRIHEFLTNSAIPLTNPSVETRRDSALPRQVESSIKAITWFPSGCLCLLKEHLRKGRFRKHSFDFCFNYSFFWTLSFFMLRFTRPVACKSNH